MKSKILSAAILSSMLSTAVFAADIKEGTPETGMFMYANSVSIGEEVFSLPVLKADDLICTTYIAESKVKDDVVEASFAQYCDPVIEEPIKLEDGSEATVITSASASTFYFNPRSGKHQFDESTDPNVLENVKHVKLSAGVYMSFSKGFENKIKEFVTQRDAAIAKMDEKK